MTDDKNREAALATRDFISIGKFIVTFSQIEFLIRFWLSNLLQIEDEGKFNAIVGPYDFSMLCTVTTTILRREFPEKKADIDKIFKKCRALNNHRVCIVHGLWTYQSNGLMARHLSRSSLKREFYYQNSEELERITETAEQLKLEILTLSFHTSTLQPPPQGANMDAAQGGNV